MMNYEWVFLTEVSGYIGIISIIIIIIINEYD